jgi:transposase InsO family protein
LISHLLAKELDLTPTTARPMIIAGVDGRAMRSYRTYDICIRMTDSWGNAKEATHTFHAVESAYFPIVLGYPWLRREDPHFRWGAKTWRFEYIEEDFEIVKPEEFEKLAEEAPYVFAVLVSDTSVTRPECFVGAANATLAPKLPAEFEEYEDVFDMKQADILAEHSHFEHAIETEGGDPPFGPLYNLSEQELKVLRQYIDDALAKGWIRASTSPAGAPVLFVPKKGGGLRLCVDYRGLNRITKKNRYPLPLISETMDRLKGAKLFTKLDLKDAYHRLRIREGDEWKTAFRTRYGHFEYMVMPFGLANAPATFQAYINHALSDLLDKICVVYLDDILIFSENDAEHTQHVRIVLDRLRQYKLYANPIKCQFRTEEVSFLGFIIGIKGVYMEASRISTITEWPAPKSIRELQVFLGFANFYRRFIAGYSRMSAPLSNLLKGDQRTQAFELSAEALQAFSSLKTAFIEAPFLQHFDPAKPTRVETDASGFAVGGVLSQPGNDDAEVSQRQYRPVAFWSRKMTPAEMNYETHDSELLAIVMAFKHWRHYLEGSRHRVTVVTDHNNLKYFMTTKELNGRQARWAERLSRFDFVIEYRPGRKNPADGPSRRPDYNVHSDERGTILLPTLQQKLKAAMPHVPGEKAPALHMMSAVVPRDLREDPLGRVVHLFRVWRTPVLTGGQAKLRKNPFACAAVAVAMPEPRVEETVTEHCPAAVMTEPRVSTGAKLVTSIDTSHAPTESREDIETGDAQDERRLEELGYPQPHVSVALAESMGKNAQRFAECDGAREPDPFVTGIDVCRHRVPRSAIVGAMGSATAYKAPEVNLLDMILDLQQGDAFVQEKKSIMQAGRYVNAGKEKGWRIDPQGLLRRHGCVFVPAGSAARDEILRMVHDDPYAGHFGRFRTKALLRRHWYWETMARDVDEYVRSCDVCQRTKVKRHRQYGALQSLPVPLRPWMEISMDFITDLPVSRGRGNGVYDALLVIVDRYTKTARYFPCQKTITAEQLADIFLDRIVSQYGIPNGITSDRGSLFTSQFWSSLCFAMKVTRRLSTAFHPQTDGQTERQNQTVEHYLRCHCTWLQDDWVDWLVSAEFSYNNSVHASTGISPFFALLGYHPKINDFIEDDVPGGEVPAARERAESIVTMRADMTKRLRSAIEYQAKWYNQRHQVKTYAIGDWVMLSTKNLRQIRPSKKLAHRYTGPFRIIAIRGTQAYRLELPSTMKVHPTFHVSLLEPYISRPGEDPAQRPSAVEIESDEDEWEIETVLQERQRRGKREFLVRWLDWPPAYDQWLAEEDLANAAKLVEEFQAREKLKRGEDERSTPKRRRRR